MQTTLFIQNLAPRIEELSQNLMAIASILKADASNVIDVKEELKTNPKRKNPSTQKKDAPVENRQDSSGGSSGESKPVITIEQVRSVLAEKSQAGLTAQVKDLLTSFGSVKLSGIDPARYGDLIEAAKELQ